jgi:hypothetical protein
VLPAVMIHLPGRRYAACFEPPVAPDRALRAEIPAAGFGATLRRAVARHPGQWCAFEPAPGTLA